MSNNLSFRDVFMKGALIFNPVLVQLAGLCPVVAASTSLKNAVTLSAVMIAELIVVCVAASALMKKIPRWVRMPLYFVTGLALICPVLWYIETKTLMNLSHSMKIYIPLIAINSVVAVHCEQFAVKNSVKSAFYDASAVGIGVSVIFVVVGALRELLGNSTIGGMAVNLPVTFKGMLMPFGCLVILGFMAALLRAFVSKRYPEYLEESTAVAQKKETGNSVISEESPEPEEVIIPELEDITPSEPEEVILPEPEEKNVVSEPEEKTVAPANNEWEENGIRIRSEEEIDEFLKSLGIDMQETGDKQ